MEIKRYESGLMASNMYIIAENGHAIVIDPCEDSSQKNFLTIDKIILTHEHYDHISGVNIWRQATCAPVLCSKVCADNIQNSRMNLARHFREFCELQTWVKLDAIPEFNSKFKCTADETFEDEVRFEWMGHEFKLFEMPGHSLGSIGILVDSIHFFPGDSLLEGTEIEFRMPGGSKNTWEKIGKPRLETVPKGAMVYPGHFNEFVLA